MKTEQYTTEKTVDDWKNKRMSKKVPRIQWKWEHNLPESVGHSKGHAKGKVHSCKCLCYKNKDLSNKQSNDAP
jgi:hypothetical protein